jgi:cytochrome oxidase assembly protein ShyY1
VRRLLTHPRWLGLSALAIAFAVACVFLGRWQWGRYLDRSFEADLVTHHYTAAPVALRDVLPTPTASLPDDAVWSRVEATGRYAVDDQLFVRNRPQDVVYGYEVVVPFVLDDGSAILVDRGWVKNGERADVLPQVAAPPADTVTIRGWLRPSEPALGRDLPKGQLASIDVAEAAADTGRALAPAYLVLEQERTATGATPDRPAPLLPPETTTGPHFAYALQWWTAAPVGIVLVCLALRREVREAQPAPGSGDPRGADPAGSSGPARPHRGRAARGLTPSRPKKVRIWDEEDE